jgi:hypothetical protein
MDIVLSGLSILKHHASVENKDGRVTISPVNASKTFVNGVLIDKATQLQQVIAWLEGRRRGRGPSFGPLPGPSAK